MMSRLMEQSTAPTVVTEVGEESSDPTSAVQQLTLSPDRSHEPRVHWTADTVDNEFMGRHKSKCCCIYKKPKKWDDDSDDDDSDSDCETDHCRGHVEKRIHPSDGGGDGHGGAPGPSCPA